jgi:2-aminobenzoate-CoA ligase
LADPEFRHVSSLSQECWHAAPGGASVAAWARALIAFALREQEETVVLLPSAYEDGFARERLPPPEQWPVIEDGGLELLRYPDRFNAAAELLDGAVARGLGANPCLCAPASSWTYAETLAQANRIANVLVRELGLKSGNRVLLRAANSPLLAACWLAVVKAGGIAVTTMPLLRARELALILDKARVELALCDDPLLGELETAQKSVPVLGRILSFRALKDLAARQSAQFANLVAARDDVALIAFTSGTTGEPKGTMHFHSDVLAICDCFPRSMMRVTSGDVFSGSPPLAFTFGLGGLLLFPLRFGAATLLLERASPPDLAQAIERHRITTLFTAPTAYRALTELASRHDFSSLRECVSAGEHLPAAIAEAWRKATGIRIIDAIGATEMLHIFISAAGDAVRPGATGKPIPGYRAQIVDDDMRTLPPGETGRLAVRGPTGCRYLDNPAQQTKYVRAGWNLTGDAYRTDADGYYWYAARTDDMIISAGYNIAGPEIENVLLEHPKVKECAVVGSPDPERGEIVKAFVVLRDPADANDATTRMLQDFVKAEIAPYKYPRAIAYIDALPRTETGKVQRFRLRDSERAQRPRSDP